MANSNANSSSASASISDQVEIDAGAVEAAQHYFSSGDNEGKYDATSFDDRGVPTRLAGGEDLSKQQRKKADKMHATLLKKLAKAEAAKSRPPPKEKKDRGALPDGFWEKYPTSQASIDSKCIDIPRLGIDVGGVIASMRKSKSNKIQVQKAASIEQDKEKAGGAFNEDTSLDDGLTEGCLEGVKRLVKHFGPANTFIISKAGPGMTLKTLGWLQELQFYEHTGLLRDNVYFCKERQQKAPVAEALGVTHFIDDRWSVLMHLHMCHRRYLFPGTDDGIPGSLLGTDRVVKVGGWADVLENLGLQSSSM